MLQWSVWSAVLIHLQQILLWRILVEPIKLSVLQCHLLPKLWEPRLFEVEQKIKEINYEWKVRLQSKEFTGSSCDADELKANLALAVDYIVALPRMLLRLIIS